MARPLRIEYDGAWYHVMNRGASRQPIFFSDDEREYFLSLLRVTTERFNAQWHAYCLMDNHYHLLLHTPNGNLQRIMRHVNGVYTQYFNRREGRDGPLFRGRYKAILVDAQNYWLGLSRYIHRNPLEAGIVTALADYRWSSYRAYIGKNAAPNWLCTRYILDAIARRQPFKAYKAFVAAGVDDTLRAFYDKKKQSPILGNEAFEKKVLAGKHPNVNQPALGRRRHLPSPEQIIRATCKAFDVDRETVMQSHRGSGDTSPARGAAMYLCQQAGMMTLSEVAIHFGLAHYGSASSCLSRFRKRCSDNPALGKAVNALMIDLTL